MPGGYVSIPNAIMRDQSMTPGTRVLFGVILSYAWESGGSRCIVSKEDLAKQAGISVSTFWASIKVLRERGLIEVIQTPHPRGVVNEYRPLPQRVRFSDSPPSDMSSSRTRHVQPSDTEEDEEKKTNRRESAGARARGLNGHDVRSLVEAIATEAADADDRKFYGLWCRGEGDRVAALLAAQEPSVRVALTEYVFTQIALGWSGRSIAVPLSGAPLERAKVKGTAPAHGGGKSRLSEIERRDAERDALIYGEAA